MQAIGKKCLVLILLHKDYIVVLTRVFTVLYIYLSFNFVPPCKLCEEYGK